jgi:hypothetical protein
LLSLARRAGQNFTPALIRTLWALSLILSGAPSSGT